MTKRLAVIALMATATGLASCDGTGKASDAGTNSAAASTGANAGEMASGTVGAGAAETAAPFASDAPPATTGVSGPPVGGGETIEGAPAFAVIFPGARVEATPLTPLAETGNDGGVVFTTDASPDVVVDFYRRKAEAAGLASIMSMNQGDTRGYGATGSSNGGNLQVVAHPIEPGRTSVQLLWSSGQ